MARFTMVALGLALMATPQVFAQNKWGDVEGRVVWGGKDVPKQQAIAAVEANVDKNHCLMDGPLVDQKWVVNPKNKGLRNTFVWLVDPDDPKAALPIHPDLAKPKDDKVVVDQPCCMFVPHALGMREGQILVAKNSAPVNHNIKWQGNPRKEIAGNVIIPSKGEHLIKKLTADPFPVKLECGIHPWMNGWVRVFDHPYFAVTDADGKFTLPKAPAGKYNLVIWHGTGGFAGGAEGRAGQPITIAAKGTKLGDLTYPPPEE